MTRTVPEGLGGQIGDDRKADQSCVLDRLHRARIRPAIGDAPRCLVRRIRQSIWYGNIELAISRVSGMAPTTKSPGFDCGISPPNCPPKMSLLSSGFRKVPLNSPSSKR